MKYLALTIAFAVGFALSAQAETPAAERAAIVSPAVQTGAVQTLKVADQPSKPPAKGKKKKKKKKAPSHTA